MKLYAITHGKKKEGADPELSPDGIREIEALNFEPFSGKITGIVIGTGRRFHDTFMTIPESKLPLSRLPVKRSSLLGNADSGKKSESGWDVILADGTEVKAANYIGPLDVGIDLWPFLESLSEGMLLVTGREFIGTLIKPADGKSATLYEIDVESRTVTEL